MTATSTASTAAAAAAAAAAPWYEDVRALLPWADPAATAALLPAAADATHPGSRVSFTRRANAAVRAALAAAVLAWALTGDARFLAAGAAAMLASWIALELAARRREGFADYRPEDAPRAVPGSDLSIDRAGVVRRRPTPANPTMNRTLGMAMPAGDGVRAEDPADRETRQRMVDAMDEAGMLPPRDDDMNRRKVIRDFYTVPSMGAVPDRRQDFLDLMYGDLDQHNTKARSVEWTIADSEIRGDPAAEVF